MQTIKISKKQAAKILAQTFPNYRGRKFNLDLTEKVHICNTNWCEGSRSQYAALQHDGFMTFNAPAPWNNRVEGSTVEMKPGMMIVEHTISCGKDLGITIYVHPSMAPKMITA